MQLESYSLSMSTELRYPHFELFLANIIPWICLCKPLVTFVIICHCSFAKDLSFYADHVPTVSTQLSILTSVKAATPEDRTVSIKFYVNLFYCSEWALTTVKPLLGGHTCCMI